MVEAQTATSNEHTAGTYIKIDPRFITPGVGQLACGILADYSWTGLPVLADALEEAGYTDEYILNCLKNYRANPLVAASVTYGIREVITAASRK